MLRRFGLLSLLSITGCLPTDPPQPQDKTFKKITGQVKPAETSSAAKNVVFFQTVDSNKVITATAIALPSFRGAAAIWGATGRDHRGHIYFGVSAHGIPKTSAHLFEYDPQTQQTRDCGGAVENLKRLGLHLANYGQNKIHTRINQGRDGFLYFASMDEEGENEDGSKLPPAGSHLWRIQPNGSEWEHLGAVPEAVIASAVGGRYSYFLAYFGHVLYRYDTELRILDRVVVGSIGGHTTRNFFADDRGHVYVPRVTAISVVLVEYDENLKEIKASPLEHYSTAPDASSHGIVGFTPSKSGSITFVTDQGRLYRLDPRTTGSVLTDLGWLHPAGSAYAASLFSPDGETQLCSVAQNPKAEGYEWVTYDLLRGKSVTTPLVLPVEEGAKNVLVYGSITRDDAGRFYMGGRYLRSKGEESVPIAWALDFGSR